MAVNFFAEGVSFKPKQTLKIKTWLKDVAAEEGYQVGTLNYVFCNDEYILETNRQYLQHDYYTDIITFDNTEKKKISGDLMISIDTVKSNAEMIGVDENQELCRVIVHGVLHLCGYKDKSEDEEKNMRKKENYYLSKFNVSII
ncbi:rRNA maturation RNase YbeY [uncultured Acetobacteroides sp.]|uniref:rRNA maturation RNase YbeY n=1 Tax=uncultured Acetobacteroides sp. TaxID=1760811 RepID=UPI0029F54A6D|nr:rRNA maturation RNase YbeY [uncultured Acetobacteroides sp.]